jgi:hypothetical protein
VVAPLIKRKPDLVETTKKAKIAATGVYCSALCVQLLLIATYVLYHHPSDIRDIEEAAFVVFIFLPLLQLFSSMVSALVVQAWRGPDGVAACEHVGKITIGTFAGAAAGIVIMMILACIMSAWR